MEYPTCNLYFNAVRVYHKNRREKWVRYNMAEHEKVLHIHLHHFKEKALANTVHNGKVV